MKTIAKQLNIKEFPFIIKDEKGNQLYYEFSDGYWAKSEFDEYGNELCFKNSEGFIEDNRPKKETENPLSPPKKSRKMKTIAQQLNIKKFPFKIKDKNNNQLYVEDSYGFWAKREFEGNNERYYENSYRYWIKREYEGNKEVYSENSEGTIIDNRPKK